MPLFLAPVDFEALHRQQNAEIDAEVKKLNDLISGAQPVSPPKAGS